MIPTLLIILTLLAQNPPLTGIPEITSGNSFILNSQPYVLTGIQVPLPNQTCSTPEQDIPCGLLAANELALLTRTPISCQKQPDQTLACTVKNQDLSQLMVESGWAKTTNPSYIDEQARARAENKGLWQTIDSTHPHTLFSRKNSTTFYPDCTTLRQQKKVLQKGEPGYRPALDPNGDGVACESNPNSPTGQD